MTIGIDWLSAHNVHVHVRAWSTTIDGVDGTMGMRINVAWCAAINRELLANQEGIDWFLMTNRSASWGNLSAP